MATTQDYLTQLQADKENLVNNLVEKGVEATSDETFTSLVPKVLDIQSGSGDVYTPEYISFYGYQGTSLENALKNIDTSNITSTAGMFEGCSRLTAADVSRLKFDNVTNMSRMFYNCNKLTNIGKINVSNKVTNIANMFYGCNQLEELDTSNWDTSNITNMSSLFWRCYRIKVLNTSNWDTSKVTSFGSTFQQMSLINEIDVSKFNTSNCTTFGYMFYGTPVKNLDMSGWDTSKATSFNYMFYQGKMKKYDLSNFVLTKATTLSYMFASSILDTVIFTSDIPVATDLRHMFDSCSYLETIDLSSFVGGNKNCQLEYMFKECKNLKEINLSNLKCYGNATIASMFYNCTSLEKIDMRSFNFTKITSSSYRSNMLYNVPKTCEIIVMNDACKTWFNTNFSTYTNVKTVAELEATE